MSMEIRAFCDTDVAAVVQLSEQLGYPTTDAAIRSRMSMLSASPSDAVWVAIGENRNVVGWIHVGRRVLLESEPFAEILGLVVGDGERGKGTGEALVRHAEAWARALGLTRVRVRSNVLRERARRFYERIGYSVFKQQAIFDRTLDSP